MTTTARVSLKHGAGFESSARAEEGRAQARALGRPQALDFLGLSEWSKVSALILKKQSYNGCRLPQHSSACQSLLPNFIQPARTSRTRPFAAGISPVWVQSNFLSDRPDRLRPALRSFPGPSKSALPAANIFAAACFSLKPNNSTRQP